MDQKRKKLIISKDVKRKNRYCEKCDKSFCSSYALNCHLFKHNLVEPQFRCEYCNKGYYRRDTFTLHLERHNKFSKKKKVYICDYCERSFTDKRNLIYHLKVHDDSIFDHGMLNYECKVCGTSYAEERNLKYHIRRSHYNLMGGRPEYLNKLKNDTWIESVMGSEVFVQVRKLSDNVLAIKKTDQIKTNLKQEYAKYFVKENDTSQYSLAVCDYCKKEMIKKSLRTHIRETHMKIKKFKCENCKKGFSRHYLLVDHVCGKVRTYKRKVKTNL